MDKNLIEFNDENHCVGERPSYIDNYDLEGEFPGELGINIQMNHDYIIAPKSVWEKL